MILHINTFIDMRLECETQHSYALKECLYKLEGDTGCGLSIYTIFGAF